MKIKPYVEKLNSSKEYKEFQKKYPDAFMIAGFFILDLEEAKNVHQIDYFIPSQKKIAAFTLDGSVNVQLLELMNHKTPEKLDMKTETDLDALPGILTDEMKNRSITEEIKKIIAIIQNIDGKKVWNLNCILSGMGILRAHVDDASQTVLKMEKTSIMDYVKKMPAGLADAMKKKKESKEEIKETIEKLEKLEEAIEKEKGEFKKKLGKAGKGSKKSKPESEEPEDFEED